MSYALPRLGARHHRERINSEADSRTDLAPAARSRGFFFWRIALTTALVVVASALFSVRSEHASAIAAGGNGKIAFTSDRTGSPEIYTANSDGTGVTRLTNNSAWDDQSDWSPDGTKIAFSSYRDNDYEIYRMDANGANPVNLTNSPGNDVVPSWSPDGSKIVFRSLRDGNNEIYVMNADGTGQTNVTNDPSFDQSPVWSPDGTKIAFSSTRSGHAQIWVMDANGANPHNVTNTPSNEYEPAWSPDGTKISFTSGRLGPFNVFVMNPDGSAQTGLSSAGGFESHWSADSQKILFASNPGSGLDVYVMDADGNNKTNITNLANKGDYEPSWQPIPLPAPPSSLTAVAVSPSQINLTWSDNSTIETGFKVERRQGGGPYSEISTTVPNVAGYSDTGRNPSTQYTYRVRAGGVGGNSSYSNEATATTQDAAPTSISGTFTGGKWGSIGVFDATTGAAITYYCCLGSDSWSLQLPATSCASGGGYHLYFSPADPTYQASWYNAKPNFAAADCVSAPSTGNDMVLPASAGVSGTVIDGSTMSAMNGAVVYAWRASDAQFAGWAVTGEDGTPGHYRLSLTNGVGYKIQVHAGGQFPDAWLSGTQSFMDAPVSVAPATADFTLGASGGISGYVKDAATAADIGWVPVYAYNSATGAFIAQTNSDETGRYHLYVGPGSYKVMTPVDDSHESLWSDGSWSWGESTPVTAPATLNFASRQAGMVTGVASTLGVPAANYQVSAYTSTASRYVGSALTDGSGGYSLKVATTSASGWQYKIRFAPPSGVSSSVRWYLDTPGSDWPSASNVSSPSAGISQDTPA